MGSPFHLINFPKRALLGIVFFCSFLIASLFGDKVTQSVIVASIEGEVSSLNLIDDFKVNMSSSYVGKKISPKTILTTGKTGKVSLLFSNGTLITIKPGSRFYLRKYKQLEAVVEDLAPPGKLEEEPTKSELSAHLDFGDLIVKAPKLKKGSSMNLSSPIGTAGIRGTMFQFMAVRNPVTGDIMGGINLVSGDIEFTDTDGNTVTILSGQSIQLATSKLGESVASQTGELVDLSSTYGPALTEAGALPPPISSIFPNLNLSGDSDEDDSGEEGSFDEPMVVGPSAGDLDFIHEIASEVFFAIGESEQVSSDFTFESIQMAPPVEAPLPEVEAPSAPASVTGETVAGGNIDRFLGLPPELSLRDQAAAGTPNADPLFQVLSGGSRIVAEFRSPDEGLTWADLDPGVSAFDFLDNDIESAVILSNVPDIVLDNPADAPGVGESVVYNVVYQVTDFRNSSTSISKEVEVVATRPTIQPLPTLPDIPFTDPNDVFMDWINQIQVFDVRGQQLSYSASAKDDSFYLSLDPTSYISTNNSNTDFQIIAKDWRGLTTVSSTQTLSIRAQLPEVTGENLYVELSDQPLSSIPHNISGVDEFGNEINSSSITLLNARDSSGSVFGPDTLIYSLSDQVYTLNYLVQDSRGISREVPRSLTISANAPNFEDDGKPFESNATWLTNYNTPTLEYTDPLNEFQNWINSQKVTDFAGSEVVITPEIVSYSNGAIPEFVAPYKTLPSGSYEIKFTAIDSRFIENVTHPDWEADLTSIYNTSFTIISTPPTLEITNGGWRDGLIFDPTGENTGDKLIEYLVSPNPEYLEFDSLSDDGVFSIRPKPDSGEESRKVYIKATAFNGTDISASIQIENNKTNIKQDIGPGTTFGVDYDVDPVGTETSLTISVNDSSLRGDSEGITQTQSLTVKLVDTLPPYLRIPVDHNDSYTVAGARDEALDIPRLEIVDNYYTREQIEEVSGLSITGDGKYYLSYPDFFLDYNQSIGIGVGGVRGFSGSYKPFITYISSLIKDPSGNTAAENVSLNLEITDNVAPTIQLINDSTYYVNLSQTSNYPGNNIEAGESGTRFEDPGVSIAENLFVHEPGEASVQIDDGSVITQIIDRLANANERFSITVQPYDEDNVTLLAPEVPAKSVQQYLEEYNSSRGDPFKFLVTYQFTDRAENNASVSRVFEFTSDPLAPAVVTYYGADYSADGIFYVEADKDIDEEIVPEVYARTSLSTGSIPAGIRYEGRYIDQSGNETNNSWANSNLVNYFSSEGNSYFLGDGILNENNFSKDSNSSPKHIVRFIATNQFGDDVAPYDLEIRVQDTTAPTFEFSASSSLTLEAGDPFTDDIDAIDASLNDSYFPKEAVTLTRSISKDDSNYTNPDSGDPFPDFASIGFWETGSYTVTYTAKDGFDNNFSRQRTISVEDNTPPPMFLVPYLTGLPDSLSLSSNFDSLGTDDDLSINFSDANWTDISSLITVNTTYLGSTTPYVKQVAIENSFLLKFTEVNASLDSIGVNMVNLSATSDTQVISNGITNTSTDKYGRKYTWYSAIDFNTTNGIRDPGVLIYSNAQEDVTVYSEITAADWSDTGYLESFTLNYYVKDTVSNNVLNSVVGSRIYTFVDEVYPNIYLSPPSDFDNLILIEAGQDIDDNVSNGIKFDVLSNDTSTFPSSSIVVEDAIDGPIPESSAIRKLFELNPDGTDSGTALRTGMPNLTSYPTSSADVDKRFRVEYTFTDSSDNEAIASRYFIVKDTTPPSITVLTNPVTSFSEYSLGAVIINYTEGTFVNDDSNFTALKQELLKYVEADDFNDIDNELDTTDDEHKWAVSIPNYQPGVVYPSVNSSLGGYDVTITVTDASGNSASQDLKLKVQDTVDPSIYLVGSDVIHDFYRYGSRTDAGIDNNQKLFPDRPSQSDFNGTGYQGGAHRLMLADYNFVDPGVYAEDDSFSLDEYPDFDGDGIGEAHAIENVESLPEPGDTANWDPGIIYRKNSLSNTTLKQLQEGMANGTGQTAITPTSRFIYEQNDTAVEDTKILQFRIEYRVYDGWGLHSDKNRTVYIYESDWNYADKAEYATPLTLVDEFNPISYLQELSVAETDYDGDGVSDFWEFALGTRFDDASDIPAFDFSDPAAFTGVNISNLKANIDSIKSNPQYSALLVVDNYLEFNGTVPTP